MNENEYDEEVSHALNDLVEMGYIRIAGMTEAGEYLFEMTGKEPINVW